MIGIHVALKFGILTSCRLRQKLHIYKRWSLHSLLNSDFIEAINLTMTRYCTCTCVYPKNKINDWNKIIIFCSWDHRVSNILQLYLLISLILVSCFYCFFCKTRFGWGRKLLLFGTGDMLSEQLHRVWPSTSWWQQSTWTECDQISWRMNSRAIFMYFKLSV